MASFDPTGAPAEIGHAGAVVEKAVEYMVGQKIPDLAIASALLGGAVETLLRAMDDAAVIRVLGNAIDSVRSGELRRQ